MNQFSYQISQVWFRLTAILRLLEVDTKTCDAKTCIYLNRIEIKATIVYYRNQRVDGVVPHK